MQVLILKITKKVICSLLFIFGCVLSTQAQINIFELMERTDLSITEVEKIAADYFKIVGTGKGSGHKQYSRWLYEKKFHLDDKNFIIPPEVENANFQKFVSTQKKYKSTTLNWSELGPQTWTYTSGWNPGVGRVTSVAVHPSDTTKIYVSSPGGGIWKSTNSGASWTPLVDNTSSSWMNVFHISIDPSDQNTLYAAAGSVIKSTNAGASWASTGGGPSSTKKVVVHPSNSAIIFATGSNGIFRSVNGGSSWTQVLASSMEDIEFNPANPNIMYASSSSGTSCVWRSSNNGVTWSAIGSASGITSTGRTLLGVSPHDASIVYAVQANGNLFGKFYKSSDSGLTYTTLITGSPSSGTNFFGYEPNGTGTTGQATYDMAICVNRANVNEVHIAGIICWKSTNGGSGFTAETVWSYPNSTGYNHADVHSLEWVNGTIYSGSDGGIYKSVNKGDDWIDLSAGLGIRQFYRISCSKTDPNVITTGAQDNGSSFRRSNGTWVDWLGADGMDNAISPTNAAIAIGTSQYGAIYKTTNSGASRSNLTQPSNGNWVTPLVMHPTNHDTIYGGWTGIWRSSNGGSNWTNISSGVITGTLTTLAVAPSNTKYIYGSIGSTLYRTNNGGSSWTNVTAPATITSIFVSQSNPEKIWITCNSSTARVYVSNDMGTNFTDLSSGLPAIAARSIVVENNSNEGTYVGMNIGVYYRDNANPTWILHANGLPLVAINEVEIQESSSKLRVATYGRGVWESSLQNVAVCNTPANLSVSNITTNSAQINWDTVSGAVNYTIEYKEASSSAWTGTSSTSNTNFTITGLTGATNYDWQVRTNCSSGASAYTQSTFTTNTPCPAATSLNASNIKLNSATLNWTAASGAIDYIIEYKLSSSSTWLNAGTTSNTSLVIGSLISGTSYDWQIKTNCSSGSSGFSQSSFSTAPPCTSASGLNSSNITTNSATISWNTVSNGLDYSVEYKESSSSTWGNASTSSNTSRNITGLNSSTSYDWRVKTNCTFDSSNFVSTSFITASSCSAPTNPTLSSATGSSITLGWSATSGATSYVVEYKTSASSSWTTLSSTTNTSYNLTGLSAGNYNWRVYANCGSNISAYLTSDFTLYCDAKGNSTASEYIDYVALGSITRTSGSDGGYYDATSLSANLKPGLTYGIILSPKLTGTKRTVYFRVYIDYNGNGVFTDAGEQVGQKSTRSAGNITINFTVPSTATIGKTRMRVLMKYNAYPTSCETFSFGEVEDFSVVITNTPSLETILTNEETLQNVLIYPVPTDHTINYSFTLKEDMQNIKVSILNLEGRELISNSFDHNQGNVTGSLNMENLSDGIYILDIRHKQGHHVGKIILTR